MVLSIRATPSFENRNPGEIMKLAIVQRGSQTAEIPMSEVKLWEEAGYKLINKTDRDEIVNTPSDAGKGKDDEEGQSVTLESVLGEIVDKEIIDVLKENEIDTVEKLKALSKEDLIDLPLIGKATAKKIIKALE